MQVMVAVVKLLIRVLVDIRMEIGRQQKVQHVLHLVARKEHVVYVEILIRVV